MRWLLEQTRAGLRARRGAALLLALLAAIIALVATATPLLQRVVQQTELDHALASATTVERSVVGEASSDTNLIPSEIGERAALVPNALGGSSLWTPTRTSLEENDDPVTLLQPTNGPTRSKMRLAGVAACADLRFRAGDCPTAGGQVAVSDVTARHDRLHVGQQIELASARITISGTVVGVYDSTTTAGRIAASAGFLADLPAGSVEPDVLLTRSQFAALQLPTTAFSFRSLRPHVPLASVPGIRTAIGRALAVPNSPDGAEAGTRALTPLVAVLDRVEQQNTVIALILEVVAIGAFGLAWLAFAVVAQRLARVRAAEWALPRLRGLPRRRRLGSRLVEPLLALLVGTVVGTAIAIAVAQVIAGPLGRETVDAAVPSAIALAGAASLGGVLALFWVSVLADRRPLDEQLRRSTEPGQLSRLGLIGQAVVVVAALAAVVALATAPGTAINGAGLLAPTLIALSIGFVGLQAALLVVRRRTRVLPTSLLGLLVWRRLGRAPSQLVPMVLVGASIALTTFVAATSGMADVDASATAAASTAASTVLHVRAPQGLPLLTAVERADPSGRRAMAAEELRGDVGTERVVAVDTARLDAVSTWRSEWAGLGSAALRRRLAPPVVPSVRLSGKRLAVDLADVRAGSVPVGPDARFELDATVQTSRNLQRAELGPFEPGFRNTLTAVIPCSDGCTLVSLTVRRVDPFPDAWSLHLMVTSMRTDRQPPSAFASVLRSTSWIPEIGHDFDSTLPRSAHAHPGPSGLAVDLADTLGGGQPGVRVQDSVEPLPALFGATTRMIPSPGEVGTVQGAAIDDSPILLHPIGTASDLPRLLGDGVMVDLRRVLAQSDSADPAPDQQVWVRGDAASIARRLRAEGVTVRRTETLGAAVAEQRTEGGPTAARFSFLGALGAAAVVLVALIGGRLLDTPDRRQQWRSFAAAGVPVRQLRRLVMVEFLAPGLAATVIGALSGAAAFALAVPHLPLADAPPDGPPSGLLAPWADVLLVPVAAVLVLTLAAAVLSRVETVDAGGTS